MNTVKKQILKEIYKDRRKGTYHRKYDYGLVLAIGGSDYYCGSPALSAMAAYKSGADLVRVVAPERAANIIASFSPNIVTYPLEGRWLEKRHMAELMALTESAKEVSRGNVAVVIGGGTGRTQETKEAIFEFLENTTIPVVVDADAIYALAKKPDIIKGKGFLLTPHSYEFFILTKRKIFELPHRDKIAIVKEEADRLGTAILLKDKPDIISDGKEVALNETGSPYMSVGGTGDALAGICAALLARTLDPFKAAQAAAYISGKAGEIAAERLEDSLTATDVIEAITEAIR